MITKIDFNDIAKLYRTRIESNLTIDRLTFESIKFEFMEAFELKSLDNKNLCYLSPGNSSVKAENEYINMPISRADEFEDLLCCEIIYLKSKGGERFEYWTFLDTPDDVNELFTHIKNKIDNSK